VFRYGTGGGFPTSTFQATNYWSDVVFVPGTVPPLAPTPAPVATPATGG